MSTLSYLLKRLGLAVPTLIGITGYAQVSGRCNLRFRVTKALDLQYVKDRSLRVDFSVLMATIVSVLRGHGSF